MELGVTQLVLVLGRMERLAQLARTQMDREATAAIQARLEALVVLAATALKVVKEERPTVRVRERQEVTGRRVRVPTLAAAAVVREPVASVETV
ncbi:hypothetical protein GCM10016234_34580 [Tianweitania populi]|uniref:Uncharacterized protein n=1 Tax=Tianweitania populi TaxID=1607949 RepID=A0A8J3GLX9_9HYPH|nr:hypothetical protein GCM10016234_34580 [Tianweitania populi]